MKGLVGSPPLTNIASSVLASLVLPSVIVPLGIASLALLFAVASVGTTNELFVPGAQPMLVMPLPMQ